MADEAHAGREHEAATRPTVPVCDATVLERLGARLGRDVLSAWVGAFREEMPRLFLDVQAACESGDRRRVQGAAHAVGTLAATFGADRLRALVAGVESAAAHDRLAEVEVRLLETIEHYEVALAAIEAVLTGAA